MIGTAAPRFQALKLSEIHGECTDFDLFMERNGALVPYTVGRHRWSPAELSELRQSRQFVLFYETARQQEVADYLAGQREVQKPHGDLLIHDGIAEFLKTRALFSASDEQRTFFQGLAIGLSRYLTQETRLANLLETLARYDAYTFYHGMRTAALAVALSQESGQTVRLWELMLGSVLHDLGNLQIDPQILNRPGPLQDAEWKKIRRHPEDGVLLLQSMTLSPLVKNLILQHHERADGQGYPHRQRLLQLAREVRLLNFVDIFAALTQPRAYQQAQSPQLAQNFMQSSLQGYIDPEFFGPLARLIGRDDQAIQNQNAS